MAVAMKRLADFDLRTFNSASSFSLIMVVTIRNGEAEYKISGAVVRVLQINIYWELLRQVL
jgi:hypothetical protein